VHHASADATWDAGIGDDPWGNDHGTGLRLGYRGELAYDELVFMGARIYEPSTRTFLTSDPLAPVAGALTHAGPYTYAYNDPVNHYDPTGRRPVSEAEYAAIVAGQEQGHFEQAWEAISEDPWGTLTMVAVIGTGVALMFVPGGQAIGAGILIGAALSAGAGLATGNFNPRSVALGGAFGAIPGAGAGAGYLRVAALGAASNAGENVIDQAVIQGRGLNIDPAQLALATATGAAGGTATKYITTRLPTRTPIPGPTGTPPAPRGDYASWGSEFLDSGTRTIDQPFPQTTIFGENMRDRVFPFADATGARTLGFGATAEHWEAMTPRQRWNLNDGMFRARISEGDRFRYIGQDPDRLVSERVRFDLTRSEMLRLNERGIEYEEVSLEEIAKVLGRE